MQLHYIFGFEAQSVKGAMRTKTSSRMQTVPRRESKENVERKRKHEERMKIEKLRGEEIRAAKKARDQAKSDKKKVGEQKKVEKPPQSASLGAVEEGELIPGKCVRAAELSPGVSREELKQWIVDILREMALNDQPGTSKSNVVGIPPQVTDDVQGLGSDAEERGYPRMSAKAKGKRIIGFSEPKAKVDVEGETKGVFDVSEGLPTMLGHVSGSWLVGKGPSEERVFQRSNADQFTDQAKILDRIPESESLGGTLGQVDHAIPEDVGQKLASTYGKGGQVSDSDPSLTTLVDIFSKIADRLKPSNRGDFEQQKLFVQGYKPKPYAGVNEAGEIIPWAPWRDSMLIWVEKMSSDPKMQGILAVGLLKEKSQAYNHFYNIWGEDRPLVQADESGVKQPLVDISEFLGIMETAHFHTVRSRWAVISQLLMPSQHGLKYNLRTGVTGLRAHTQKLEEKFQEYEGGFKEHTKIDLCLHSLPDNFAAMVGTYEGKEWRKWEDFKTHILNQVSQKVWSRYAETPLNPRDSKPAKPSGLSHPALKTTPNPRWKKEYGHQEQDKKRTFRRERAKNLQRELHVSQALRKKVQQWCQAKRACFYCGQVPQEGQEGHQKNNCPARLAGKPGHDWTKHDFGKN